MRADPPIHRRPAKRGRPRNVDEDQFIANLAAAVAIVFGLGRQRARDVALAWHEGRLATPTLIPRGAHKAVQYSVLAGYELPPRLGKAKISKARKISFEGRARTIRRNKLRPQPAVVDALTELLRLMLSGADILTLARAYIEIRRMK